MSARELHTHMDKLLLIVARKEVLSEPPQALDETVDLPLSREASLKENTSVALPGDIERPGSALLTPISDPLTTSPQYALPQGPLPFTGRGGPITRADSCLFFRFLPQALTERHFLADCLKRELVVESMHMWNNPAEQNSGLAQGEAYVVFQSAM
jgi:hypothetical protein